METYSTTQASNIVVLAGAISILLTRTGYAITSEEIQTLFGAILIIVGLLYNWFHRFSKGDITIAGFRK